MINLQTISQSHYTIMLLAELVIALVVVIGYRKFEDWNWRRNHPITPRSHSLTGRQMEGMVRSEGRLHFSEATRHQFKPMDADPIRCDDCGGVLV